LRAAGHHNIEEPDAMTDHRTSGDEASVKIACIQMEPIVGERSDTLPARSSPARQRGAVGAHSRRRGARARGSEATHSAEAQARLINGSTRAPKNSRSRR